MKRKITNLSIYSTHVLSFILGRMIDFKRVEENYFEVQILGQSWKIVGLRVLGLDAVLRWTLSSEMTLWAPISLKTHLLRRARDLEEATEVDTEDPVAAASPRTRHEPVLPRARTPKATEVSKTTLVKLFYTYILLLLLLLENQSIGAGKGRQGRTQSPRIIPHFSRISAFSYFILCLFSSIKQAFIFLCSNAF